MSADGDRRFAEALVTRLHTAQHQLARQSAWAEADPAALANLERRCSMTAPQACAVAKGVFDIALADGVDIVCDAALELHDTAAAFWRRERNEELEAEERWLEQEAAHLAESDQRLRAEEEARWARLEFCSTSEFESRLGRRDLRPVLRARGYLEGDVGSWRLSEKALGEGVGKVDVRGPRQSVILWAKAFVEAMELELSRDRVPA